MDLGYFHPIIIHFVIALGITAIALRLVSLTRFLPWTRPAASACFVAAAVAGVLAVMSGDSAHGRVERVPGAGQAVHEHEEAGEWARNVLLLVGLVEVAGYALRKNEKYAKIALYASAVLGLVAGATIYRAGDLGGDLVYEYAGGVGIRSGDPDDVKHLLVAGLYHQASAARAAGRKDEAVRLTDELVQQLPDDPAAKFLSIESTLKDKQDPQGALTALRALTVPKDNPRFAIQAGLLTSEAFVAAGQRDSALAVLKDLEARYPRAQRFISDAMAKLQ